MGIVSFSVLATVGLLSVANDTSRRSRDETFAAQIAANEFERMRSLNALPTAADYPRYYDTSLADLGTTSTPAAIYELHVSFVTPPAPQPADRIINAEVRFPANAPNQTKILFSSLVNVPQP
jgi:Tfp pilus assembly protein PilV